MVRSAIFKSGRQAGAAALLFLLAVCAFFSTPETVTTVSVPLERVVFSGGDAISGSMDMVRNRLRQEREREISLLDSVAGSPQATKEMKEDAAKQTVSLSRRMEKEADIEAALAYMGFVNTAVICGAQAVTVFASAEDAVDEKNRIRMIDAAVSHAGVSPDDVQIILAKK